MKYYKVTMVRGHLGAGVDDGTITFYYAVDNAVKAMQLAQRQPGVKHKRLPLACIEVQQEEYNKQRQVSAYKRAKCREKI